RIGIDGYDVDLVMRKRQPLIELMSPAWEITEKVDRALGLRNIFVDDSSCDLEQLPILVFERSDESVAFVPHLNVTYVGRNHLTRRFGHILFIMPPELATIVLKIFNSPLGRAAEDYHKIKSAGFDFREEHLIKRDHFGVPLTLLRLDQSPED